MLFKDTIRCIVNKMGFILIPKWRYKNHFLTERVRKIISEYHIDCILDVGANTGQYRNFLRMEVEYKGLIISFEPDPDNIEKLIDDSRCDDRWIIQGFALGNESGKRFFNIMEASDFNSFLSPDDSGTAEFIGPNTVKRRIEVQIKKLEEVLPDLQHEYGFNRVFLKLDTQGSDLDIFYGALGCLDSIIGIQTELSFVQIYKNAPQFDIIIYVYKDHCFELSGLYAVDENRFPHAVEYDGVFLKK